MVESKKKREEGASKRITQGFLGRRDRMACNKPEQAKNVKGEG